MLATTFIIILFLHTVILDDTVEMGKKRFHSIAIETHTKLPEWLGDQSWHKLIEQSLPELLLELLSKPVGPELDTHALGSPTKTPISKPPM